MARRPARLEFDSRAPPPPPAPTSPQTGEAPPALSPLDALAMQGRLLAQKLEASNAGGRRVSRLPPYAIATALSSRRGFFQAGPGPAPGGRGGGRENGDEAGFTPNTAPAAANRPVSHYPVISAFDDAESIMTRSSAPTIKAVLEDDEGEGEGDDGQERDAHRADPYYAATAIARAQSPDPEPERYRHLGQSHLQNQYQLHHQEDRDEALLPGVAKVATGESLGSQFTQGSHFSQFSTGLVPPRSPGPGAGPPRSPRSIFTTTSASGRSRLDSDDDAASVRDRESNRDRDRTDSRLGDRRPSFGSLLRGRSPLSPVFAPPRSPSLASEQSQVRASVNFSRPMSRIDARPSLDARPSFDTRPSFDARPSLDARPSIDARPSYDASLLSQSLDSPRPRPSMDASLYDDYSDHRDRDHRPPQAPWVDGGTPVSLTDDESSPHSEQQSSGPGAASYTYSKFSLPRGRPVAKSDMAVLDDTTFTFSWEQPVAGKSNVEPLGTLGSLGLSPEQSSSTPSLPLDNKRYASGLGIQGFADDTALQPRKSSNHKANPSFPPPDSSSVARLMSADDLRARAGIQYRPAEGSPLVHEQSPRPGLGAPGTPSAQNDSKQTTPQAHLAKGIECHENGELQKSTYHLRLAARAGNATGMLLYALACRHGWGMRPNQAEGVIWLRKAVDSTGIELNGDAVGDLGGAGGPDMTVAARRKHKAQLALAIYELGVSYMNGWGISQDKALGLRCFEIAGGWGDADALAEAGYCYARGVGCKKNLAKAADLYRRAEKEGVEIAGNSWIHKDKYKAAAGEDEGRGRRGRDRDKDKEKEKEKDKDKDKDKGRSKSRTRALFGGRKKQPAEPLPAAATYMPD